MTFSGTATHVSAVMCTRNRAHSIAQAVSSVMSNDYPNFALTIIDQSTTNDTELALAPIAAADPRVRYVHTNLAGLSRAYNSGIRATDGEILVFTDDDCIVATDWISRIVAAFESEPEGELLYGQVIAASNEGDDARLTPTLTIDKPERLAKGEGFRVFGMGANFAARRRLFDRIGFFDEVLGGGGKLRSSQDFDLEYRAYKGGSVILLRPEVTLRHDGKRDAEDWPTLLFNYGAGDGAFYFKHVRCRDLYATGMLLRSLLTPLAKGSVKKVLRREGLELAYVKGFVRGMRDSLKFKVDRVNRLYVNT